MAKIGKMVRRPAISHKDEKHIELKFGRIEAEINYEYRTKLLEKQAELGNRIHGGCAQNELIGIKL